MTPTSIVWSPTPPECREKVSCASMLDAARAWAERQFKKGMLARSGTEVLVRCETDPAVMRPAKLTARTPDLSASTYQVKITIVNAPAFRASLVGMVFEGRDPGPGNGSASHG